jgi:acyl-CoA thioesterase-1
MAYNGWMMARCRSFGLRGLIVAVSALQVIACGACGRGNEPEQTIDQAVESPSTPTEAPRPVIVCLGDSLTAGLGLLAERAYPHLVEQKFAAEGYEVEVLNAGVSGDTSAGGLRRVEPLLGADVAALVLALGGNDALRGLSAAQTYDNLAGIIEAADAEGIPVVLTGMEAPPNLGDDYRDAFREAYIQLARDYRDVVVWVPFLLEGVAGQKDLNQADGIHPNEKGAQVIADLLYPKLRLLIDQLPQPGFPQ